MNTRQSDPCVRPRAAAIGILLLAAALPLPAGGSAESAAGQRAEASEQGSATITISGHGEVSAQPDRATVTVGVQLFDKDARAASSALRERMNAVIDAIRSLGIADRHIRTTNYSISFERDYQAGRAETIDETIDQSGPPGVYRVENMVRVLITD
ncbi:MAG: SIMPL domain-containing protein, partial [Spirochaetaceae bacterium]